MRKCRKPKHKIRQPFSGKMAVNRLEGGMKAMKYFYYNDKTSEETENSIYLTNTQ